MQRFGAYHIVFIGNFLLVLGACQGRPSGNRQRAVRAVRATSGNNLTVSQRGALRPITDVWVWIRPVDESAGATAAAPTLPTGSELTTYRDRHSVFTIFEASGSAIARLPGPIQSQVQPVWRQDGLPVIPSDRVVLRLGAGVPPAAQEQRLAQLGVTLLERLVGEHLLVRVPGDTRTWATRAGHHPDVALAEPDLGRMIQLRTPPADPYYDRQWHLENTGQDGALPGADVNAEGAWALTTGSPDVVIAVIDSGVDPDHEDLQGCKQLIGYDGVLGTSGVTDENGHGTAVAGVAAAWANNGLGVAGVCPTCRVLPIRIGLGADAEALGALGIMQGWLIAYDSHIARAFVHAVDSGAWILSNSWGHVVALGPQPLSAIALAALDHARVNGRGGLGAVVLFAAGNEAANVALDGYASHATVLAIGASNDQDRRSAYSNYGSLLSVVAPSNGLGHLDGAQTSGIWTTDISGPLGYNAPVGQRERLGDAQGNYTARFGGTSSAAPLAAGIAGLILSVDRSLSATAVREILESTAVKIDQAGGTYNASGHSPLYGYGRVDAEAAVAWALAERGSPVVGDACAGACGGDTPVCLQDAVFGDYCSHTCDTPSDCPEPYGCQDVGTGSWVCVRPAPCAEPPELCNGVDDNGDGEIDEGCEGDCTPEQAGFGACDGDVLRYCDGNREASVDCAALGAACLVDADGVPRCDFACPEPGQIAPETPLSHCAGNTAVVTCRYREFLGQSQLVGISVQGCAEGCAVSDGDARCICSQPVDVCDGDAKVKCIDGVTRRIPCAGGCDDSLGVAVCTCTDPPGCNGNLLTYCNNLGQVVEIDCPEECVPDTDGFGTPDCACAGGLDEAGVCSPDGDVTLCLNGQTVTFDCPETCTIWSGSVMGHWIEDRAVCSCEDLPEEGLCDGDRLVTCPYGYRQQAWCANGCGFVIDIGDEGTLRRGCLCDGMTSLVACDGADVVVCLSNGETMKVPCSSIEPGTDTCVPIDIGDQDPRDVPPFECVIGSGDADAGVDNDAAVAQDASFTEPPPSKGCAGCQAGGDTTAAGALPAWIVLLPLLLLLLGRSTRRRDR